MNREIKLKEGKGDIHNNFLRWERDFRGFEMKITYPDGNYITYAYNSGGLCTSMVTSADSQTTTITYDALRRRSTVTYPTTTNVVTTYTYDNLDRITKISSVAGATTYDLEYTYVTNKDLVSQQVIKLNAVAVSTIDLTYDSTGRVTEEKVTKTGPTVTYDKQYTYDKVSRRLSVKDVTNGNWLETSTFDLSGRLTRITVTSGTGSNPFSWPKGTTNVTCDANGNITQLVGRNVDDGTIWKVAHQFDYEQRVTRILLNNGDVVTNTYDGMGYRLREATVAGGATTTKNLVPILGNRVIQERDGSDAVTARYYWDGGIFFKKDHSTSAKYFVPEIANSPFTGWNNAGTFNRYDLWDTFGVLEDQSAAGSLSPFQLAANMRVDTTHLTASPQNIFAYPEVGSEAEGTFNLSFQRDPGGAGGGDCDLCDTFCCLTLAHVADPPPKTDCFASCARGGGFCQKSMGDAPCNSKFCRCLKIARSYFCKGGQGLKGVGSFWQFCGFPPGSDGGCGPQRVPCPCRPETCVRECCYREANTAWAIVSSLTVEQRKRVRSGDCQNAQGFAAAVCGGSNTALCLCELLAEAASDLTGPAAGTSSACNFACGFCKSTTTYCWNLGGECAGANILANCLYMILCAVLGEKYLPGFTCPPNPPS